MCHMPSYTYWRLCLPTYEPYASFHLLLAVAVSETDQQEGSGGSHGNATFWEIHLARISVSFKHIMQVGKRFATISRIQISKEIYVRGVGFS